MNQDGWLIFDDSKANARDNDPSFRNARSLDALLSALRNGSRCCVADIDFCGTEARREAETVLRQELPSLEVRWHFFANDPAACEANVRDRNRESLQRELALIAKYSQAYRIPQNAVVLPVSRNENRQLATGSREPL